MSKGGETASFQAKAVRDYMSRDVFAYLSLRHYLRASETRSEEWATRNAIQTVLSSPSGRYLRTYHFKDTGPGGIVNHRELWVPSAAEAIAEATLISRCAHHYEKYTNGRVFSYIPTGSNDKRSYFKPYMEGLRRRQEEITLACQGMQDGLVVYIDIKTFYPSITPTLASQAWARFAAHCELERDIADLGKKLIDNHARETQGKSILTGPMFSHFLANLVLDELDRAGEHFRSKYIRYVDDITLVGSTEDISSDIETIRSITMSLGLSLHDENGPKTLRLPCTEWLKSAHDFRSSYVSSSWMRLVGDVKRLLLLRPRARDDLLDRQINAGLRLPLVDYQRAVEEASSFERVRELGLWGWLWVLTRRITPESVVRDALELRRKIFLETRSLLEAGRPTDPFHLKRIVSQLRYRLGRLVYLADLEQLSFLDSQMDGWPELGFHRPIIRALTTGDCSMAVKAGSNVAQATAQVFRASLDTAKFSSGIQGEVETQGLAVFLLNNVSVEAEIASSDHPIIRLARGPITKDLMREPRGLLQEVACLNGIGAVQHSELLSSAFDVAQEVDLAALEQDYGYYM